ncbi:uncharacterized protein N7469_003256 [Penicillium citrinum]|uniref:Uncharacterized protein n=1 Tax=Penicillium citrinum TaxID=5077 RepID=A0A9W9PC44_PENCI|nr:uncharacterized protein N7469_003256 [Penicillium citrinum]KAJ5241665.1 hypothetical protein N7469_003256 [Penicillium citrinum]
MDLVIDVLQHTQCRSFADVIKLPSVKIQRIGQIARVPLRNGGVLQTIMFIASQFAPSLGQEAQIEPSNGPHFTLQAIMQISRLLSSVPQDIGPTLLYNHSSPATHIAGWNGP